MEKRTVKRYSKNGIRFHWIFSSTVIVLVLTGIIMHVQIGGSGSGYSIGIIHRIFAVLFLVVPVLYSLIFSGKAVNFLKETFNWGKEDLKWYLAAPDYYFGGSGKNMPPQGHLNTGQKMWQLVLFGTAIVFFITGTIMWFFRAAIPINIYQWLLFLHVAAFVTLILMFLVHLYMSVLHPRMRGAFYAMVDGKVSSSYAKEHHRKWFDEMTQEESATKSEWDS